MKTLDFSGKVAIVTGSASGIGLATATQFAQAGAFVALADRDEQAGQAAAESLRMQGARADFIAVDVADPVQVDALVQRVVSTYKRLDCAFNNAGITQMFGGIEATELATWDKITAIDLSSIFYCLKYQIAAMKALGTGGSIVNNSSDAGLRVVPGIAAYNSAKHGVLALTRTAAREAGANGIRVNAICPGATDTPMMALFTNGEAELVEQFSKNIPLGRFGTPDEIADAVLWLCSDLSRYVTGAVIPVDGGLTA